VILSVIKMTMTFFRIHAKALERVTVKRVFKMHIVTIMENANAMRAGEEKTALDTWVSVILSAPMTVMDQLHLTASIA